VARIDNQTLTLESVRAQFDTTRGISEAQLQEYIRRWVNNELLYREAVRRGLNNDSRIAQQVEEAKRQLLINALLEQEIYTTQSMESTREEVERYFREHLAEFALSTDVALVSYALFGMRDVANAFRARVLGGTSWNDALREVALEEGSQTFLGRVDSVYVTQATLLPPELWRVAAALRTGEPSFPIRTNDGYYVLIVWRFDRQGAIADIGYVEEEIRNRIALERRQRLLEELLENLRNKHAVEILVQQAESDTIMNRYEEE
jgi:peptidyl-prolyl cis-trans isomerase C